MGDPYYEIEGNISGRLSFNDSPFLVKNDIFVQLSDTLLIDAGVYIYFEQDKRLNIEGVIIARGESNKPIFFRTYNEGTWSGISIKNSPEVCEFRYCIVQQVLQPRF